MKTIAKIIGTAILGVLFRCGRLDMLRDQSLRWRADRLEISCCRPRAKCLFRRLCLVRDDPWKDVF